MPPHEVRWLNLTGFCLRPGFRLSGDDFRIEQARRIYAGGLTFGNQVQYEIDWWIFCGRIAGGLNRNQQADIFQRLSPVLLPKQKSKQRINQSLFAKCGAPPPAWNCFRSKPKPNWAKPAGH